MKKPRSLKDILLVHELTFVFLVTLAGAAGALGIHLSEQSSIESERINRLVQEIQQTRGDLYRQMKELFDAYFLADREAPQEYDHYTVSVKKHFVTLLSLAQGEEEKAAIRELEASYSAFVAETSTIFNHHAQLSPDTVEKTLNSKLEAGVFQRYEVLTARAEQLLNQKQEELRHRLEEAKRTSITLLAIPIVLATLLLLFSRVFLKRVIVRPIEAIVHATTEISAGRLQHKVPAAGAAELAALSLAINHMAEELARSQEALIRTEKQAAQGQLVPMLAHNIRNPLASIRATAQVADNQDLDADTRESLQGIISTVDRLERWTGSLLAYLHPLKPQVSETSLRQIIDGALVPLQVKLREKSLTLELPDWEKQDDRIWTDEHLLEQALYNLLLNAAEAVPNGSRLDIHADLSHHSLRLLIADRGPGMPFTPDPNATTAGPTTKRFGTGLGIPFTFKVCEALAATISFRPREGGGTLIELELPRRLPEI